MFSCEYSNIDFFTKAGPTGPIGPAGLNGSNGSNGLNGAANIFVATVYITSGNWSVSSGTQITSILVPSITSLVMTNGTVQVFFGSTSSDWIALPLSYQGVEQNVDYAQGIVNLTYSLSNGSTPGIPNGNYYKIVVIPPALKKLNINYRNYNELKAAYNL